MAIFNNINSNLTTQIPMEDMTHVTSKSNAHEQVTMQVSSIVSESADKDADGKSINIKNIAKSVIKDPEEVSLSFSKIVDPATETFTTNFAVQELPENGKERSMLPNPEIFNSIMEKRAEAHNNNATKSFVTKKMSSWLSRLIDRRGEKYIYSGLSMDEVSRNADIIIDDIVSGRIDYTKYGKYVIEPVIIETLISFCNNKMIIAQSHMKSSGYLYNDYTNIHNINPADYQRLSVLSAIDDNEARTLASTIAMDQQDLIYYTTVYNKLLYVQSSGNASVLFNLAAELNNMRKNMRKRY